MDETGIQLMRRRVREVNSLPVIWRARNLVNDALLWEVEDLPTLRDLTWDLTPQARLLVDVVLLWRSFCPTESRRTPVEVSRIYSTLWWDIE